MQRSEFIKKMPEIMEKTNCIGKFFSDPDWFINSGDIGICQDDTIVIDGVETKIKVSDVKYIKYRYDTEDDENYQNFIYFDMGDMDLFYYFKEFDEYELHIKGREYSRYITVFSILESWDGKSPFIISKWGELLAYLGNDAEIVIPSSVTSIGERFCDIRDSGTPAISKVTLSPGVKKICQDAFIGSGLKEIDLCEVEEIGDGAFWGTNIESIVLPKTLKNIGKNVFRGTKIFDINAIKNESDLELTDDIIECVKSFL